VPIDDDASLLLNELRGLARTRRLATVAREAGLEPLDWQVLVAVAVRAPDGPPAHEIVGSSSGAVANALSTLRTQELIRRHQDPADRRRARDEVTAAGRHLLAALAAEARRSAEGPGTGVD